MVSCQTEPTLHAYAWQIGPFSGYPRHVVSLYATGLNNRDNNVREEMKLLTRWGRDKMTTICISFLNTFFQTTKKSLQFVPKSAVNYKAKLVQAMAWHSEESRPMVHIYESRGLIELITSPYWENISMRRKTVLFEHPGDTFTPIAESGQFQPLRLGRG